MFSVIITTHNRPMFLADALKSVCSQLLPAAEVILVDDGSNPAVAEIVLDECRCLGTPCSLIRLEDVGPAQARNTGARAAKSEYLAFLDDDDIWKPNYFINCKKLIEDTNSKVVITWMENFEPTGRVFPGKALQSGVGAPHFVRNNPGFVASNLIVSRKLFIAVGGYDGALLGSEDRDLAIRLLSGGTVFGINKSLDVRYRIHGLNQASAVGSFSRLQLEGRTSFFEKYRDKLGLRDFFYLFFKTIYFQINGSVRYRQIIVFVLRSVFYKLLAVVKSI